jgi:hypothetical protein
MLIPVLTWAIHRLDPAVDILLEPDFAKRRGPVGAFLASYETSAMLTFVHRDAEGLSRDHRRREFEGVDRKDVVPVIPVRMTEAWMLIDGPAIAQAADRPGALVQLPPIASLEDLNNPKQMLEDLLMRAAGELGIRRRKRFRASLVDRRVNVASLIEDYSPLERLVAFRQFQLELAATYPYQ